MNTLFAEDDDELLHDDALQGAVLAQVAPIAPPPALREKILRRVRAAPTQFATVRNDPHGWRELIPGLAYRMLSYNSENGSKSFLLRAAAGARLPPHGHSDYEHCLVLEGSFCMGDLCLRAGDFHLAAPGSAHEESWTDTGVTVYLHASITDYPGIDP